MNAKELSKRLATQADRVARHLLPNGHNGNGLWCAGDVSGAEGESLKVELAGERQGRWRDWASDEDKGDLLDLWAKSRGTSLPEAIRQAKAFLGIHEPPLSEKTWAAPKKNPLIEAAGKAMNWLIGERKIPAAIVNRYRVCVCPERKALAFPSYSPDGVLVNHSYRTLDKETWQDKGCAPSLFGWHALTDAWKRREILICEGQIDALTWASWGIEAVSLPNGSGMTWIEYEWENLAAFDTIFLAFDMDKPGRDMTQKALARLGKHRCRVVLLPAPHKDANDALKAGNTAGEAAGWVSGAKYQDMEELITSANIIEELKEWFFPENVAAQGFPIAITKHRDKRRSFLFRPGELTLWTGTTGHGKSTALNMGLFELSVDTKAPSLLVSLEMPVATNVGRMLIAADVQPNNRAQVESVARAMSNSCLFYRDIGQISKEKLFDVLAYAHARYGVVHIGIDSLMRINGMEEDYPAQTSLVVDLVTFAKRTGCHIHLVAHPRKSAGDDAPRSQDIAGSGNLRNNADNVLSFWRNMEKERKQENGDDVGQMPDAILFVEKDRVLGDIRKFPLVYLRDKYRFAPWAPDPAAQSKKPEGHPNARRR